VHDLTSTKTAFLQVWPTLGTKHRDAIRVSIRKISDHVTYFRSVPWILGDHPARQFEQRDQSPTLPPFFSPDLKIDPVPNTSYVAAIGCQTPEAVGRVSAESFREYDAEDFQEDTAQGEDVRTSAVSGVPESLRCGVFLGAFKAIFSRADPRPAEVFGKAKVGPEELIFPLGSPMVEDVVRLDVPVSSLLIVMYVCKTVAEAPKGPQ
jgi:hypothetical protein